MADLISMLREQGIDQDFETLGLHFNSLFPPDRIAKKGNPYHDVDSGKLTTRSSLSNKGEGSWALGKVKLKLSKVGKGKEGQVIQFSSTKHPCGRAARQKGKDIKCSTGKSGRG